MATPLPAPSPQGRTPASAAPGRSAAQHAAAVLLAIVCAASALAMAGCRSAEPVDPNAGAAGAQVHARFIRFERQLASPDREVREQAAIALLSMDYAPALQAVRQAMRAHEDSDVRIDTIRAAAFCADHRCFQDVLNAMDDPDASVAREAARALTRFTRPEEVDAITAMIMRPATTAAQRELLFRALGEALAIRAAPVLLVGLEDENQGPRIAAWQALRTISRRDLPLDLDVWREWVQANAHRTREDVLDEHLQALRAELDARARDLGDLTEANAELSALMALGDSQTPALLTKALGSRHQVVRLYASFRLNVLSRGKLNGLQLGPEEVPALAQALKDPSEDVRFNALSFAVRTQGEGRDELVRVALGDDSAAVLTMAIEAVRAGTGEAAVRRLEDLVTRSGHAGVREAAATALGRVGSDKSVPALMAALDDSEANVRWFAVEGLGKLGATQAVPRISGLLVEDGSAIVREIAAITLGELGQPAGVPALRAALSDEQERVRQNAVAALVALATGDCERMMVIAGALREAGYLEKARQVLLRVIEQYGTDEAMAARVARAREELAALDQGPAVRATEIR